MGVCTKRLPIDGLIVSRKRVNYIIMSTILQPLIDRLREAGSNNWERIAEEAGVARTLPRKLVYGDRTNPRVLTIQPLLDYFARSAPTPPTPAAQAAQQEAAHG